VRSACFLRRTHTQAKQPKARHETSIHPINTWTSHPNPTQLSNPIRYSLHRTFYGTVELSWHLALGAADSGSDTRFCQHSTFRFGRRLLSLICEIKPRHFLVLLHHQQYQNQFPIMHHVFPSILELVWDEQAGV
jgi:hypothetical protein